LRQEWRHNNRVLVNTITVEVFAPPAAALGKRKRRITMRSIIGKTGAVFVAAAAAGMLLVGCPNIEPPLPSTATYQVTFENLTTGQPMSPILAATHSNSIEMFRVGKVASAALEAIAEDGDNSAMETALQGSPNVTDLVNVGEPLTPQGVNSDDFSSTATFQVTAANGDVLSLATMLIATNDGITGLDAAALPESGSKVFYAVAYDAGTEDNTESSADIPDPASALGPIELGGDPNGNENAAPDTDPPSVIALHPNVQGDGNLNPDLHGWVEPVARITVTRLAEE
jgi:hypothetical protein